METENIPKFTVLSDREAENGNDLFALESRLGSLFDLLRHRDTIPPLAMALYGHTGTGRSTALRWLHAQTEAWNQRPEDERADHPMVLPVRISANQLLSCGGVVPNLVSAILLACLDLFQDAPTREEQLQQAAKICAGSLGHDFVAQLKQRAIQWDIEEAVSSISWPEEQIQDDSVSSYAPCLGLISQWLNMQAHEMRIAVFIDDLDYFPAAMMTVFTAIGFVLRSSNLIFLVAVDPSIAQTVIMRHYREQGYDEVQSRQFLSKIFTVECYIDPCVNQIQNFYDEQVKLLNHKIGDILDQHLTAEQKGYIKNAILHLANNNPRKIRLLLNSALMKTCSVIQQTPSLKGVSLSFAQQIQIYLLQRWLSYFSVGATAFGRADVLNWFILLSQEACKPETDYQQVENRTLGKKEETFYRRPLRSSLDEEEKAVDPFEPPEGLSYSMIQEWVWDLLKIPFGIDVSMRDSEQMGADMELNQEVDLLSKISDFLKDGLAAAVEKPASELLMSDLDQVTVLDYHGQNPSPEDLLLLGKLKNLERLDLHNSQIDKLDGLVGLTKLKFLNLTYTPVVDLAPLKAFSELESLDLSYTTVEDISPVSKLKNLKTLILYGVPIQSIAPLKELSLLNRLNLSNTGVSDEDLDVLEAMPALKTLYLRGTSVSPDRINKLVRDLGFLLQVHT